MLKQASAICQACGAEFTPERQAQAYCSQRRRYRDGQRRHPSQKQRFREQRQAARQRGIPFLLTFEEWLEIWVESGHIYERGCGLGRYVMARHGDTGPYSRDNVKIIPVEENNSPVIRRRDRRRINNPDVWQDGGASLLVPSRLAHRDSKRVARHREGT
jgi:hypothetical protein